jgi:signal peptidase I
MRRVAGWTAYWVLFGVAIVAVLGSVGAELASFRIYSVPSDSMDNTVQPNDQILLVKGTDVRRGDVVVFAQQGHPGQRPGVGDGRPATSPATRGSSARSR